MRSFQYAILALTIISCGSGIGNRSNRTHYDQASADTSAVQPVEIEMLNDSTMLVNYTLFNRITIGIPEQAIASEKNNGRKLKKMGFAFFGSEDGRIDITVRKMDLLPLENVKSMMDAMSVNFYKGEIMRSEIVHVNGIELYVTDISGYWNGSDEKIGMFRYYFNSGRASYNLLMKYPVAALSTSKQLKQEMLESINIR